MSTRRPVPDVFCWTRFGVEAGESVSDILCRKELERRDNKGTFLWGIGNGVGMSVKELVSRCREPEVLFSPIKSAPRPVDLDRRLVVAWTIGEDVNRNRYRLPIHSTVTSRDPGSPPRPRYALVCFSAEAIGLARTESTLEFSGLRNILSGKPLGSSQVTAVVARAGDNTGGGGVYSVAFRACLAYPYFIRLRDPRPLAELDGSAERAANSERSRVDHLSMPASSDPDSGPALHDPLEVLGDATTAPARGLSP